MSCGEVLFALQLDASKGVVEDITGSDLGGEWLEVEVSNERKVKGGHPQLPPKVGRHENLSAKVNKKTTRTTVFSSNHLHHCSGQPPRH